MIIPYGADIADRGYNTPISESDVFYKLTGEPGSRIFKLEWKNVGFYREIAEQGTANNYTNFQLWIYEGSSDIEVRFGPNYTPDFDYIHFDNGVLVALSDSIGYLGWGPGQILYLKGPEDQVELVTVASPEFVWTAE